MADTWIARTPLVMHGDVAPELSHEGWLGFFNAGNEVVEIKCLRVESPLSFVPIGIHTGSGDVPQVVRITAHSGGTALTPRKHDTSAADLPSQVEVRSAPASVTSSDVFRSRQFLPGLWNAGGLGSSIPLPQRHNAPGREFFDHGRDGAIQSLVLRAGQGIALQARETRGPGSIALDVSVTFRDATSGATYTATNPQMSLQANTDHYLSVMNNTGSTVVLEVLMLNITSLALIDDNQLWLRLLPIHRAPRGGTTVIPVPYDSANVALPNTLTVQRNFAVESRLLPTMMMSFRSQRNPIASPWETMNYTGTLRGMQPVGLRLPVFLAGPPQSMFEAGFSREGIVLRKDEGVAVTWGYGGREEDQIAHVWAVEVAAEFTVSPPSGGEGPRGMRLVTSLPGRRERRR